MEFILELVHFLGRCEERADSFLGDSCFPEDALDLIVVISHGITEFDQLSLNLLVKIVKEVFGGEKRVVSE